MEEASLLEEVALQEEVALLEEAALLEEVRGPLSIDKGHTLADGCCIWDLANLVPLSYYSQVFYSCKYPNCMTPTEVFHVLIIC